MCVLRVQKKIKKKKQKGIKLFKHYIHIKTVNIEKCLKSSGSEKEMEEWERERGREVKLKWENAASRLRGANENMSKTYIIKIARIKTKRREGQASTRERESERTSKHNWQQMSYSYSGTKRAKLPSLKCVKYVCIDDQM